MLAKSVHHQLQLLDFISVVDIQKNQKITDIKTGNKPHGTAVSPDGNWIAVSNEGDNTVSIIKCDRQQS